MPEAMITKLIREAMPRLKEMGREEIAKEHAAGLRGVYMIGSEIVYDYPDGRKEVRRGNT